MFGAARAARSRASGSGRGCPRAEYRERDRPAEGRHGRRGVRASAPRNGRDTGDRPLRTRHVETTMEAKQIPHGGPGRGRPEGRAHVPTPSGAQDASPRSLALVALVGMQAGPVLAAVQPGPALDAGPSAAAATPPPACTTADAPAPFSLYSQWASTFLDTAIPGDQQLRPPAPGVDGERRHERRLPGPAPRDRRPRCHGPGRPPRRGDDPHRGRLSKLRPAAGRLPGPGRPRRGRAGRPPDGSAGSFGAPARHGGRHLQHARVPTAGSLPMPGGSGSSSRTRPASVRCPATLPRPGTCDTWAEHGRRPSTRRASSRAHGSGPRSPRRPRSRRRPTRRCSTDTARSDYLAFTFTSTSPARRQGLRGSSCRCPGLPVNPMFGHYTWVGGQPFRRPTPVMRATSGRGDDLRLRQRRGVRRVPVERPVAAVDRHLLRLPTEPVVRPALVPHTVLTAVNGLSGPSRWRPDPPSRSPGRNNMQGFPRCRNSAPIIVLPPLSYITPPVKVTDIQPIDTAPQGDPSAWAFFAAGEITDTPR